jgi:hypothetical protein
VCKTAESHWDGCGDGSGGGGGGGGGATSGRRVFSGTCWRERRRAVDRSIDRSIDHRSIRTTKQQRLDSRAGGWRGRSEIGDECDQGRLPSRPTTAMATATATVMLLLLLLLPLMRMRQHILRPTESIIVVVVTGPHSPTTTTTTTTGQLLRPTEAIIVVVVLIGPFCGGDGSAFPDDDDDLDVDLDLDDLDLDDLDDADDDGKVHGAAEGGARRWSPGGALWGRQPAALAPDTAPVARRVVRCGANFPPCWRPLARCRRPADERTAAHEGDTMGDGQRPPARRRQQRRRRWRNARAAQ